MGTKNIRKVITPHHLCFYLLNKCIINCRLNDEEYLVQRTTFFIISNLILKDVIRAQSNISQMAIFLVSSETELCDMSKQFFPVLASKGNVLYNILPDIFSYLCGNEKVTQENFTTIMT